MKLDMEKLKREFRLSKEIKCFFLQCAILALFIFLSIFWKGFSIIALIVAIVFVNFNRSGKSVYFLLFLLPFVSVFKFNTNGMELLSFVAIAVIGLLGVKLVIDLFKKKIKINIQLTIILAVFIVYLLIQISISDVRNFLSLTMGLALLYVLFYYKKDLNLKEITFVFGFGTLLSVLIGLFIPVSFRLQSMITQYYAMNLPRFSACAENVNVFAGELIILLSCFTCLYIRKQIGIIYYVAYFLSFLLIVFTMSKSAEFMFIFITMCLIIFSVKNRKKKFYIDILFIITSIMLSFSIAASRVTTYLSRPFEGGIDNTTLSSMTTGRFDIWIVYCKEILSSPIKLIFGQGISAPYISALESLGACAPHNIYVQCLYVLGIFGTILFLTFLCSYIGWKKVFKLNFGTIVILITVAMFLFGLDFLSYRFSNYFILIAISYFDFISNKKEEKLNEKINNSNTNIQ